MPHADTFGLNANVGVKGKWPEASAVDDVLDVGVGIGVDFFPLLLLLSRTLLKFMR